MKAKNIVSLLFFTLVIVIVWIIFSLYHKYVQSTIDETLQIQLTPIDPNFDKNALENLKRRNQIEPDFKSIDHQTVSTISATPTRTINNVTPTLRQSTEEQ